MAETKYGKYILTKITPFEHPSDRASRVFYLDGEVIKGAFYVECAWCLKGSDESAAEAHAHDFDEVIGFFGTDPEDPHNLYGEIEFWLGEGDEIDTVVVDTPSSIYVPANLGMFPMIWRNVTRPIIMCVVASEGIDKTK